MKIIGLPKNHRIALKERRVEATKRERVEIQSDCNHPCQIFLPSQKTHKYSLRSKSIFRKVKSNTDRHKSSFIPWECLLNV